MQAHHSAREAVRFIAKDGDKAQGEPQDALAPNSMKSAEVFLEIGTEWAGEGVIEVIAPQFLRSSALHRFASAPSWLLHSARRRLS